MLKIACFGRFKKVKIPSMCPLIVADDNSMLCVQNSADFATFGRVKSVYVFALANSRRHNRRDTTSSTICDTAGSSSLFFSAASP